MRYRDAVSVVLFGLCGVAAPAIRGVTAEDRGVPPQPHMVFVTSVWGSGDLSTWADSGQTAGLAGADAVCRARAAAGGLPNAAEYVAWMSDSSDDAYCRIHGMTGKKAANCGIAELPTFAGPWARTDQHPFGARIHHILGFDGEVYAPVLLDEFGIESVVPTAFTGTDTDGEYQAGTSAACADWSDDPVQTVAVGSVTRTSQSWTGFGTAVCSSTYPVLCIRPGSGAELLPRYAQGALAFVTRSTGSGFLGGWPEAGEADGLDAGDSICRARALAGGLPHPDQFKAWLSTSTVDAADRFSFGGPWVRPDGVIVADTKAELISGQLKAPMNQDVFGLYYGNHGVWTGTQNDGLGSVACADWSSESASLVGTTGAANATVDWSDYASAAQCSWSASLYCLSNVPSAVRIFLDGFETADDSQWTSSLP